MASSSSASSCSSSSSVCVTIGSVTLTVSSMAFLFCLGFFILSFFIFTGPVLSSAGSSWNNGADTLWIGIGGESGFSEISILVPRITTGPALSISSSSSKDTFAPKRKRSIFLRSVSSCFCLLTLANFSLDKTSLPSPSKSWSSNVKTSPSATSAKTLASCATSICGSSSSWAAIVSGIFVLLLPFPNPSSQASVSTSLYKSASTWDAENLLAADLVFDGVAFFLFGGASSSCRRPSDALSLLVCSIVSSEESLSGLFSSLSSETGIRGRPSWALSLFVSAMLNSISAAMSCLCSLD